MLKEFSKLQRKNLSLYGKCDISTQSAFVPFIFLISSGFNKQQILWKKNIEKKELNKYKFVAKTENFIDTIPPDTTKST